VSDPSYGLIVEGDYDKRVFEELVRNLSRPDSVIVVRPCDGVANLNRLFPAFLHDLEYVQQGRPVDKALVIRDSGGKDAVELERDLERRIRNREFRFPQGVKFCIVNREMETWLLADADAISAVALARGGRAVPRVQETPESIVDPKDRLKRLLRQARLEYTAEVCAQIAQQGRIETLRYRCPSFRSFEERVLDC